MCLNEISDKKIASKDIVCYKILRNGRKNILVTYYQWKKIKISNEYKSSISVNPYLGTIDKALHSFKFKKDVRSFVKSKESKTRLVIVKCIIPKDSIYYNGTFFYFGDPFESYASNKLKYIEIIK